MYHLLCCPHMAQEIVRGRLTWFVALSGCLSVSTYNISLP